MRWRRYLVLALVLFLTLCSSVSAEEPDTDWTGTESQSSYDLSKYIANPDVFKDGSYNLTRSLKSYSNIGYQIMFIVGGIMLIPALFKGFTGHAEQLRKGVEKRALNREIQALDNDENRTDVINTKIQEREMNLMAQQRFRAKNWDSLVEDGVHKKELARDIEKEDIERNREDIVKVGVLRKDVQRDITTEDAEQNREGIVAAGVLRRDLNHSVSEKERIHNRSENRNYYAKRKAEKGLEDE